MNAFSSPHHNRLLALQQSLQSQRRRAKPQQYRPSSRPQPQNPKHFASGNYRQLASAFDSAVSRPERPAQLSPTSRQPRKWRQLSQILEIEDGIKAIKVPEELPNLQIAPPVKLPVKPLKPAPPQPPRFSEEKGEDFKSWQQLATMLKRKKPSQSKLLPQPEREFEGIEAPTQNEMPSFALPPVTLAKGETARQNLEQFSLDEIKTVKVLEEQPDLEIAPPVKTPVKLLNLAPLQPSGFSEEKGEDFKSWQQLATMLKRKKPSQSKLLPQPEREFEEIEEPTQNEMPSFALPPVTLAKGEASIQNLEQLDLTLENSIHHLVEAQSFDRNEPIELGFESFIITPAIAESTEAESFEITWISLEQDWQDNWPLEYQEEENIPDDTSEIAEVFLEPEDRGNSLTQLQEEEDIPVVLAEIVEATEEKALPPVADRENTAKIHPFSLKSLFLFLKRIYNIRYSHV